MPVQTRTHPGEGHQARHWAELASQGGLAGAGGPGLGLFVPWVQPAQAIGCGSETEGSEGPAPSGLSCQAPAFQPWAAVGGGDPG